MSTSAPATVRQSSGSRPRSSWLRTTASPNENWASLLQLFAIMSRNSAKHGSGTSEVEVTNVSPHGFWVYLGGRELFVSFQHFPWFADAPIAKIVNVEWPSSDHLYWPDLDVDLSVRSITSPEDFPLEFMRR
jgi:hypothetical protein